MQTNKIILGVVALLALGVFTGYIAVPASTAGAPAGSGAGGQINLPLGTTQTLSLTVFDALKGQTTISSTSNTLYKGTASSGAVPVFSSMTRIGSTTTTSPGQTYTMIVEKPNYFSTYGTVTTDNQATDYLDVKQEAADTSISFTILNSDGLTQNLGTSASGSSASIAAATPYTFYVRLTPSALYKTFAGPLNKYSIIVNSTNTSSWDTSGFTLNGIDGSACVQSGQPTPTGVGNTIVKVWDCSGDVNGLDVGYKQVSFTVKTGTTQPGLANHSFCLVGWDIFNHTITGVPTYGAVKDTGANTLQTPQCAKFATS